METLLKKDWVFIINPVAGNGFAKKYVHTLEAVLKEYCVNPQNSWT